MFDAYQYEPRQGTAPHPVGNGFAGTISNTEVSKNKENTGGFLKVTLKSDAGSIDMRYNLWNKSEKTVEIARQQLSALCYATGRFQLRDGNNGKELVGAQLRYDVGLQDVNDPNGYVEVKHVYDVNGNEPGKINSAMPQQNAMPQQGAPQQMLPQQQAPMQQGANGAWGNPPEAQGAASQAPWGNPPQQAAANPGWAQPQQQAAPAQPQQDVPPWMRSA